MGVLCYISLLHGKSKPISQRKNFSFHLKRTEGQGNSGLQVGWQEMNGLNKPDMVIHSLIINPIVFG